MRQLANIKVILKEHSLEIIVFISGAVVMILEIVGSRVMAPFVGTSIFVWTSLIGIILGSLSIGYYYGGQLADKNASLKTLSKLLFFASCGITWIALVNEIILSIIPAMFNDIRTSAILSGTFLFAPASVLLGMVSPYAVRLKIENVKSSGTTVGNLYALSTVGSIFGTFLAGFYLITVMGTIKIIYLLAVVLIALSIFTYADYLNYKFFILFILAAGIVYNYYLTNLREQQGIYDMDTKYSRVIVKDVLYPPAKRPARVMYIDNVLSSGIFLDGNDILFDYLKYYRLVDHFAPSSKRALLIGGAGFVYPSYYIDTHPEAYMDTVEIDDELVDIAKEYFSLRESDRLKIIHEDGRTFFTKTGNKYDAIFMDAFNSNYSIPFHLTTKEAVAEMYNLLADEGVVVANIISGVEGKKSGFLHAEYNTYKQVFPQVYVYLTNPKNKSGLQNVILIAIKSDKIPEFSSIDRELNAYLQTQWTPTTEGDEIVLTDSFAPVEKFVLDAL